MTNTADEDPPPLDNLEGEDVSVVLRGLCELRRLVGDNFEESSRLRRGSGWTLEAGSRRWRAVRCHIYGVRALGPRTR